MTDLDQNCIGGKWIHFWDRFHSFSKSSEVWHLFLIFIFFIGIGLSTHDISTLSTIAKWFESKRGLMTSIAKIGTAMGQMVMPPLIAF